MASEDVIELGSSDEEAEPAPKKANLGKRRPNAMVQIPPGLTIKPPKPAAPNINPIKKLLGKGLTVTKVNKTNQPNQPSCKIKNGQKSKPTTSKMPPIQNIKPPNQSFITPMPIRGINPIIKKLKNTVRVAHIPQVPFQFPSVKIQTVQSLNSLPAGLTVSKTPGPSTSRIRPLSVLPPVLNHRGNKPIAAKRPAANNLTNVKKKQKVAGKQMLTVDLDDEEAPTTSSGPQWYLRPEDSACKEITEDPLHNSEPSMEEQNNAEPTKFVEITIEDSPLKPVPNKRTHEIGAELAITIDDSPVKAVATKSTPSDESDNDNSDKSPKDKQSKKKLEYQKEVTSAGVCSTTIEIELEPIIESDVTENDFQKDESSKDDQSKNRNAEIITTEELSEKNKKDVPENDIVIEKNKNDVPEKDIVMEKNKKVVPEKDILTEKPKKDVPEKNILIEKPKKDVPEKNILIEKPKKDIPGNDIVIEIFESPAKTVQTPPSTPKKDVPQQNIKVKPMEMLPETSQSSEFHPVYQEFIDLCLKFENSNDMKTIVEKKIKNYYRQVPKDYTESEDFIDMVQSKIFAMRAGPDKLYLYIKDIVDELNLQRKMSKAKPTIQETRTLEAEKFQYGEESEFDSRRQRQIRKLEKTLKKLHRAIQKLEEQEVDFDDEEDSVYLLTESDDSDSSIKDLDRQLEREHSVLLKRYKERMVRVHAKFCQLTNTKMPSEPRIQIQQRPGQPAGPARRLEKWVNRKVPIGKPLPFPDFHDVLKCVRDANNEEKLGWNEADIMEEARDLFTRCGKKLQRRRQENEWRLAASRISMETDPAENSEELKNKLESNKQMASNKETEVFNKYADKQSLLNLEPVEIEDKEADESPQGESEDDEPQEECSTMENKEKRKERLRRLIHEKSRKNEYKEKESKSDSPSQETSLNEDDTKNKQKVSEKKEELDAIPGDNKDSMDIDVDPKDINDDKGEVHSISGDSKIDSEVDELHLLQKLHSDEVNTSTVDSSDSESPIDISDTLSSDNKKPSSDVISIENSSYSETEGKDEATVTNVCSNVSKEAVLEKKMVEATEKEEVIVSDKIPEVSQSPNKNRTNNQEYTESVESILLATTDEETDCRDESPKSTDECVNLKDDAISIGETTVEQANENRTDTETSSEAKDCETNAATAENLMITSNVTKNSESLTEYGHGIEKQIDNRKDASASNKEVATGDRLLDGTGIPSVETLESDNSEETSNTLQVADVTQDAEKNHTVSLESDNSQEAAKQSEDVTMEEEQVCLLENHLELKKSQDAVQNEKLLEENDNPSVETLESDDSQKTAIQSKEMDVTSDQQPDRTDIPSIETLESDNSQEADKQSQDVSDTLKDVENVNLVSLESDNSQEATKQNDAITIGDKEQAGVIKNHENTQDAADQNEPNTQPEDINNPSVETLESDNSQELSKENKEDIAKNNRQFDVNKNPSVEIVESEKEKVNFVENKKETLQVLTKKDKDSFEIYELSDSNSPDLGEGQNEQDNQKPLKENKTSAENNSECLQKSPCEDTIIKSNDVENLKSSIEDFRSGLTLNENLATATSVNE